MWTNVSFNNVDLASLPGVQITKVQFHNRPKRINQRKKLARQNGSRLVNTEYDTKVIQVEGVILGSTKAQFEQRKDVLFRYLEPTEATFAVDQAGERRNYQASVDETSWTTEPAGSFGMFGLTFVCGDPFAEATGYTLAKNVTGITLTPSTQAFTAPVLGSYKAEPVISVTVTSQSTVNVADNITITNPADGKYLKVTRVWADGDILIINTKDKTVEVNGAAVDFSGVFFELEPGSSYIKYEDSFSISRNVALRVEYKKRDL